MYRFEYLDHTADVEVRGIGDTVEEAFCAVAAGMFNLMIALDRIAPASHSDWRYPPRASNCCWWSGWGGSSGRRKSPA